MAVKKKKYSELMEFLRAFDNEELADGAWMCMIQDGVVVFNKENNTNYDPHEAFLDYVEHIS